MRKFINELGNEITVNVSEKPINDVGGVLIYMEGPTSVTENHITRAEAEILLEELKEVLDNPSTK